MSASDSTVLPLPWWLSGSERYLGILRASRHLAKQLSICTSMRESECGRDFDKVIDVSSDGYAGYD